MVYNSKTVDTANKKSSAARIFDEALRDSMEKITKGLGLKLLELAVFRRKGSVQIKLTVYKGAEPVSVNDCAKVHRAVLPRLELAFRQRGEDAQSPGSSFSPPELYVEVSSPGIDRVIREGSEFVHFTGRPVKCYRTDISVWVFGKLVSSDEEGIVLQAEDGETRLCYEHIGKARLSH
jgi:ribosome maturation factor RimP